MKTKTIKSKHISQAVKRLFSELNFCVPQDITQALERAVELETGELAKMALQAILENNAIAKDEGIPLCQDTGMAVVFVEYGDRVTLEGESLESAVNEGVRLAYSESYLRKSVVQDPIFNRRNTGDNTPAVIHTEVVQGDSIKITAMAKGFGSENMSRIAMLTPAKGVSGVKEFVLDTVKIASAAPCPPIIVGVGIGGTFEKAAVLAKKSLSRDITQGNGDPRYEELEQELLHSINQLEIGAAGFGGRTTALGVNIEACPTHIAGLPVAVNICCHALRHAHTTVEE